MLPKKLIFFLHFLLFIMCVKSECTLRIEGAPVFVKDFGTRKIILNNQVERLTLGEGDIISAYCSAGIRLRVGPQNYINAESSIKKTTLQCLPNEIFAYKTTLSGDFKTIDMDYNYDTLIACNNRDVMQLYESHRTLPNCAKYLSYGIGTVLPTNHKDIVSAALCYDLNALNLKYAAYFAYRPKYEITTEKHNFINPAVSLDEKLTNFDSYFHFMSELPFNRSRDLLKDSEELLQLFDFDYGKLIQDKPLENSLSHYASLLNIVWWRNLRLGSWRYFLNALEEHTKDVHYMVYTGTSGLLQMPTAAGACNKTRHLSIAANGTTVNVPEYVWSYLIAAHENVSEAFVVIGYNSPFYTTQNHNVTFCKDICQEITWLQSSLFAKVRSMPTMGLVFCCRPEEIAQHLDNFPQDAAQTFQVATKTEPAPKTTSTSTSTSTTTTSTTMDPFESYDD